MNHMMANRLKELIAILGISAAEFARNIKVDSTTISKCMNGKRKPARSTINSIIVTYNVNPKWLEGEDVPVFLDNLNVEKRKLINKISELNEEEIKLVNEMIQYVQKVNKDIKKISTLKDRKDK